MEEWIKELEKKSTAYLLEQLISCVKLADVLEKNDNELKIKAIKKIILGRVAS